MNNATACGQDLVIGSLEMPRPAIRVAITYHSLQGHVAKLARAVADGVGDVPDAVAHPVLLDALTGASWETIDRADAIVFGCPTYMGGASAVFKTFAEQSLRQWLDNLRWRHKVAAGFTHSQALSGDKLHTLQYLTILAAQHGMLWVTLDAYAGSPSEPTELNRLGAWLGVISQSDRDAPVDEAPPASDLATARHLGRRVAQLTRDLLVGRHVLRLIDERSRS
jgi:NAD(P)H dehydrogenase (quinone)